jgi:ubiquinone/menaquinone biosynthesis C-methylase UbiE
MMFQKYMKLSRNVVNCTDIEAWGPYQADKKRIPFKFKYIENDNLMYPSNSFDLITCIFTLHHITAMGEFIDEIRRVLKPGGFLMLIEHSVYTDYDKILVNIQHLLFSAIFDKTPDFVENPNYIKCYNMYEWDFIMASHNLIPVDKNSLIFGNEYSLTYDNVFYGMYQK